MPHLGTRERLVQLLIQHGAEVLGEGLRMLHGEGAECGSESMRCGG